MDTIKLETRDGLATVTIDRQAKLNALNAQVLDDLEQTFLDLKQQDDIRVIIITGAGEKAFVAGADISQFPEMTPETALSFARRGQEVFSLIESSHRPVIAAVNGFALGGGCELAMACHLRFASEAAVFGQPEVKLGVIAGYGGTQRLPRLIGKGRALDLLLSGRLVKSGEALEMGLVNQVFPAEELMKEAAKYARLLMEQGPIALTQTLEAVSQGLDLDLEQGLEVEAGCFKKVFDSQDRVEGAKAFLERRPPVFKNC